MSATTTTRNRSNPDAKWVRPVPQPISTAYGVRGPMWSSGMHTGADFAAPTGTPVKAVAAARVVSAGDAGAYGNRVVLSHSPGFETWYCHLSSMRVGPGGMIPAGTVIGAVGSTGNTTGPHLHLEVRVNGVHRDPAPYLSGAVDSPSSSSFPNGASPAPTATNPGTGNPALQASGDTNVVGDVTAEVRRAAIILAIVVGGVALIAVGVAQGSQPLRSRSAA